MQTDFTKIFKDIPTAFNFDQKAFEARWKSLTDVNEKMTGIGLDAATQANDIAAKSAHETFANLRELTKARNEPQDYVQAMTDFAQAQVAVAQGAVEAFATVTKGASTEASDVATKAGEEAVAEATKTAQDVSKEVTKAAQDATKEVTKVAQTVANTAQKPAPKAAPKAAAKSA